MSPMDAADVCSLSHPIKHTHNKNKAERLFFHRFNKDETLRKIDVRALFVILKSSSFLAEISISRCQVFLKLS